MTSFRQIEANRRNARLITGPVTEERKKRSRQNVGGRERTCPETGEPIVAAASRDRH